jgi:hypothetical protein
MATVRHGTLLVVRGTELVRLRCAFAGQPKGQGRFNRQRIEPVKASWLFVFDGERHRDILHGFAAVLHTAFERDTSQVPVLYLVLEYSSSYLVSI